MGPRTRRTARGRRRRRRGVREAGEGGVAGRAQTRRKRAVDGEESTTKKPSEKVNGRKNSWKVGKCCESKSM